MLGRCLLRRLAVGHPTLRPAVLRDPVEVLRHHLGGLADHGVMVMIDFDIGSARAEPSVPLFDGARD